MIEPYNLTVCQPTIELVFDDRDVFRPERLRANVLHISEMIRRGAREWRSKLFVLPQASFQGCVIREVGQWVEAGLSLPGPETELLGQVARETGAYVAACGFEVIDGFPGRYWNTAFVIAPSGELVLIYRKHYAMTSKTRPVDVHAAFVRRFGADALFPVVDTPIGRIGAAIAGDVNWPEVTRCLGMRGAEVIVNPTATGARYDMYGRAGGDAVRATRAFENLAYLAAPNVGRVIGDSGDPAGLRVASEVFDFNGALIARAEQSEETMVTARIDIEALRRLRATPMANFITELQPEVAAAEYARVAFWAKDNWLDRPIRDQGEILAREQAIWTRMCAGPDFHAPSGGGAPDEGERRMTEAASPEIEFRGLLMVTASVPDPEAAARTCCAATGQHEVARHPVEPALAELWGVGMAHDRAVVLGADDADRGYLRLVATDLADYNHALHNGQAPAGPLGFEFLSRDVDEAVSQMRALGFEVVGGPLDFDNGPAGGGFARAARVVAPGGYTLLINTIKRVPPPRVLPRTELLLGGSWNFIVTAIDRAGVEAFYGRLLGMTVLLDGVLDQDSIRETNRFPPGWAFEMLVYGAGAPMQMIENEIHPADHLYRPERPAGRLLRGNAVLTLLVESLDPLIARAEAAGAAFRGPVRPDAFPYGGRRAVALDGPNGEMVEFVETGHKP